MSGDTGPAAGGTSAGARRAIDTSVPWRTAARLAAGQARFMLVLR
jgi:hypothetical protein